MVQNKYLFDENKSMNVSSSRTYLDNDMCVDMSVTSAFTKVAEGTTAVEAMAETKYKKYQQPCEVSNLEFVPFMLLAK